MKAAIVMVVATLLGLGAANQPASGFIHCVGDPPGAFYVDITWQINNDVICFTLSSECDNCWLGLGLNPTGQRANEMEGGDFYVATFTDGPDGNFIEVSDLYLGPKLGQPNDDLSNPKCFYNAVVPPYTATQADGVTSFSFCRLLVTGDNTCDHDIIQNTSMEVLCAHGTSNTFGYHGPDNKGFVQDYFFDGNIILDTDSTGLIEVQKSYATFVAWHACIMFLAFGILIPFGLFVARFLKSFWWWFPLHIAIQLLSVVLTFIAFILIVLETPDDESFTFWHSYVGLAALILIWLSPFLGLISHLMWDPNRSSIPIFPDQVHWYVGRLGVLAGFAAIYLGIYRLEDRYSEGTLVVAYVFSILLVFYFASLITISIAQRFKDPSGYDTIQ